ncbi:hypothetical protein NKI79_21345 [Mesorhizobium sp. M0340]|uniref:hypothetical protein n=1 Tax=Mesorhizobium sp. M0340 TaxID=2956939 RepID=UPI00333C44D7
MKRSMLCALAMCLAGCGTVAPNTDVPNGIYTGLTPRPTIADDASVSIVSTGPAGVSVSGTSCKNKLWQPAPSEDNAIALMKQDAKAHGMNIVHSMKVENDGSALLKNCWAAITASGIAFKKSAGAIGLN